MSFHQGMQGQLSFSVETLQDHLTMKKEPTKLSGVLDGNYSMGTGYLCYE